MAIEFTCPTCQELVSTPDAAAGRKGRCPHCSAVVQIPTASAAVAATEAGGQIEFTCGSCRQVVSCPPAAAGKRGRCPHCQAVMHVPLQSTGEVESATEQQRRAAAAAQAARTDPWSDFAVQTYTPGAKPLVVWDGGRPAEPVEESPNTAGEGAKNWHAVLERVAAAEAERRGLPWDDDTSLWSLRDTMFYLCTSPKEAFDDMYRKGGFAVPFTFLVFAHLMAQIVPPGVLLVFGSLMSLVTGEAMTVDWLRLFFACGVYFLMALGSSVVGALLYATIGSGVLHLFLLAQGAARDSFEATFRIVCYSTGASSLLSATIILMPIAPIYWFVLPIVGVYRVHRVPVWQSIITVIPATIVSVMAMVVFMWALVLIVIGILAADFGLQQGM